MSRPTLVWTRSLEDWATDQALLVGLKNVDVVHLPCIETTALPASLPTGVWDCAVFTSAHAVDFALANPSLNAGIARVASLYTHGASTAERLAAAGLAPTLVKGIRTAEELAAWLKQTLKPGTRVLVPTAAEPAFDLAGTLTAAGLPAAALACYQTSMEARSAEGSPLSRAMIEDLNARLSGVICFASPSAVKGFVKVFAPQRGRLATALKVAAIGPTTAAAARGEFKNCQTAFVNELASLVTLAQTMLH